MAGGLRTGDYEFDLPPELIAQSPLPERDASRLMVVLRGTGEIRHQLFTDLPGLIPPGDVLVVNRTRVLRARLPGTRRGSGAPAELLLLRPLGNASYEAMVSPGGKLKPGRIVDIADGVWAEILEVTDRRTRIVRLHSASSESLESTIERHGRVPLPPYIDRADTALDEERYQTVYAREPGSVAAPTAGLHFSGRILEALGAAGVERAEIVLHVGAGTFKPVEADDPDMHDMHEETYAVPSAAAQTVNTAKREGRSVWAVGTTSARALEAASATSGQMTAGSGETRLFIRPPYEFRMVDHLITNFHLPRSTLIMLVAAFAGYELTMRAYREAVAARYRFFSYGDSMAVI